VGEKGSCVLAVYNNPGNLKPLPNQTLPGMMRRDAQDFAIFRDYDACWKPLVKKSNTT
jgi:hypothetical protein